MIHESYYWKKELYTCFLTIAKFLFLKKRFENSYVKIEKAIMMGAYIIRKLDEANKMPPDLLNTKVTLPYNSGKNTIVDFMNSHHINRHYDLDNVLSEEKDWRFIINQLIHSFSLFYAVDNDNNPDGFMLNSDKSKKDRLYFIDYELLLTIFLSVSEGTITSTNMKRAIKTDKNGNQSMGEFKLINAVYSYPEGFVIHDEIRETLKGNIYTRDKTYI